MDITSIAQLQQELNKRIQASLTNSVAPAVKKIIVDTIQEDVYDVYEPKQYHRRGGSGGLKDPSNLNVESGVNEITITNVTPPNPAYKHDQLEGGYIDYAVQGGVDYDFYNPGARPYTADAKSKIQSTKMHVQALKKDLGAT